VLLGYVAVGASILACLAILLFIVAVDGQVSRLEGILLVGVYAAYVLALMNGANVPDQHPKALAGGGLKSWLALIAGLAIVIGSSEVAVNSVVHIAHDLEISEAVISVLVIGLGTSLPELSISISAILKNRTHLSVGNIVGSNILDTLLPIGLAAMISDVTFDRQLLVFDLPYIFVLTTIVLAFFITRRGMSRREGLTTLALYGVYVAVKLAHF